MIYADAVLYSDRNVAGVAHGCHAVAHELGFGHQAGAKATILYSIRRAAAVQVDLIIAPLFTEPGAGREIRRRGAAEL